jgi:hypothetical protein
MDTGNILLFCSTVWLYATGHWIGGTVSLTVILAQYIAEEYG